MLTIFIITLGILSLLLDWLLYRQLAQRFSHRPIFKKVFLASSLLLFSLVLTALIAFVPASRSEDTTLMRMVMWVIFLFFMSLIPKLIYMVFWSAVWVIRKLSQRPFLALTWVGTGVALGVLAIMLWGATVGRSHLRVEKVEIFSDRLPAGFDGYKIAQISDLHLGNLPASNTLVKRMVDKVNALQPDIVVMSGDLVNISVREMTPKNIEILSGLNPTRGVFSVYGNHDLGFYMRNMENLTPQESVKQLAAIQKTMGWHLLDNESMFLVRGDDSISISGVNYPSSGYHNGADTGLGGCDFEKTYAGIPDSLFNLLIAHSPQNWDQVRASTPADLTLSGHVHAMQMKIKIGKWAFSPASYLYPTWSGLYEKEGKYLYINDGIGYVMYPMRIGCNPEITLITLRSKQR